MTAGRAWAMDNWPAHRLKPDGQPDGRLLRTRPQVRQLSTASRINGKADDEVLEKAQRQKPAGRGSVLLLSGAMRGSPLA